MKYRFIAGIAALLALSMAMTGCGGNTSNSAPDANSQTASSAEAATEAQAPGKISYAPSEEILNASFSSGLIQIGNDIFKQGGYMTVSDFIDQYGDKYDYSEITLDRETDNGYFFYYKVWNLADPNLGIELYTTPTPNNNGVGTVKDAVICRFRGVTKDKSTAPTWKPHVANINDMTIEEFANICKSDGLTETEVYSTNGSGWSLGDLNANINCYFVETGRLLNEGVNNDTIDTVRATVEFSDTNLYGVKPIMPYLFQVYHQGGESKSYATSAFYTGHEVFHNS